MTFPPDSDFELRVLGLELDFLEEGQSSVKIGFGVGILGRR